MSSRGDLVGSGPQSGVYQPRPTPASAEEMPVYISDELLSLGGRLNNVLEGGAFPPQSELPKRYREGMMIYFTQPVKNPMYKGVLDKDQPEYTITAAGIWLYKGNRWWKIIDDPTALVRTLTVYLSVAKGSDVPSKPPANKYLEEDLNGWKYSPSTSSPDKDQWMCVAPSSSLGDPISVEWGEPILFNSQGDAGQPGADGYSIVYLYIASTNQPVIADDTANNPVTTSGEPFVSTIPPASHPNGNYIWVIQGYFRNGGLRNTWSVPAKLSTPDTTTSQEAYQVARNGYSSFNPDADGLPGADWTYVVPTIPNGYILWKTTRLSWNDGSPQTSWATPYKANGEIGATSETRYLAKTGAPVIKDANERDPVSTEGEVFTATIPNTSHPDADFIWVTTGVIDRLGEMQSPWSAPVKYATPDSSENATRYALGTKTTYPTFNPSGDTPGSDWVESVPPEETGKVVWITTRLQWTSGEAITPWSIPLLFVGTAGAGFYSILDNSVTVWPSNATERFESHVGRFPILDDVLTFTNTQDKPVLSRRYDDDSWVEPTALINGDLIATGTISGDRITAGTSISAPIIQGGQISIGSNFSVNSSGVLTAKGANITGTLNSVSINSGSINIGNGKFVVNSAGVLTAQGAVIAGGSKFVGTIEASGGKFSGNIMSTATIQGGTISGSRIEGGSLKIKDRFSVDTNGNMICNNAQINGMINGNDISNADIRGGTLGIGAGGDYFGYHTFINSSGQFFCDNVKIKGDISATSGTFSKVVIKDDCTIEGTVEATNVRGSVVSRAEYLNNTSLTYYAQYNWLLSTGTHPGKGGKFITKQRLMQSTPTPGPIMVDTGYDVGNPWKNTRTFVGSLQLQNIVSPTQIGPFNWGCTSYYWQRPAWSSSTGKNSGFISGVGYAEINKGIDYIGNAYSRGVAWSLSEVISDDTPRTVSARAYINNLRTSSLTVPRSDEVHCDCDCGGEYHLSYADARTPEDSTFIGDVAYIEYTCNKCNEVAWSQTSLEGAILSPLELYSIAGFNRNMSSPRLTEADRQFMKSNVKFTIEGEGSQYIKIS